MGILPSLPWTWSLKSCWRLSPSTPSANMVVAGEPPQMISHRVSKSSFTSFLLPCVHCSSVVLVNAFHLGLYAVIYLWKFHLFISSTSLYKSHSSDDVSFTPVKGFVTLTKISRKPGRHATMKYSTQLFQVCFKVNAIEIMYSLVLLDVAGEGLNILTFPAPLLLSACFNLFSLVLDEAGYHQAHFWFLENRPLHWLILLERWLLPTAFLLWDLDFENSSGPEHCCSSRLSSFFSFGKVIRNCRAFVDSEAAAMLFFNKSISSTRLPEAVFVELRWSWHQDHPLSQMGSY